MTHPYAAVLVGLGAMGAGTDDARTARHYPYASHAAVLAAHPAFRWVAAVDPDPAARAAAHRRWPIPRVAASLDELADDGVTADLVVIAVPPDSRAGLAGAPLGARLLLVEKPLGRDFDEARRFADDCARSATLTQVNLWRRCDSGMRALAHGGLADLLGDIRGGAGVYGNGLANNGTHLVDLVRMLCGEPDGVARLDGRLVRTAAGPIAGDTSPGFVFSFPGGALVPVQALDFGDYREIGLELWGSKGRLRILNEGLCIRHAARGPHRALEDARETPADRETTIETTAGSALWEVYDNLAEAAQGRAALASPLDNALRTASWVHAIARLAPAPVFWQPDSTGAV
jgi:predicted dehydrogenase